MLIFSAPARYVQGPGVLDQLGAELRRLGRHSAVVIDAGVRERLQARIEASHAQAGLSLTMATFAGEVTAVVIDRLAGQFTGTGDARIDVVVGVGGGKALDAAKAVSLQLGARCASVPTIASTDAPASFSAAIYNDAHEMVEVRQLPRNPELVLADTTVMAAAPLRFLRAGIGDAISKRYEAQACLAAGAATLHGARPSQTGLMAAELCFTLIARHGVAALAAIERGDVAGGQRHADVEALIEATTLLSTLSFENGGLSVAHAIARGLPLVPRSAGTLHGEHVAYGLLVQFALEGRSTAESADLLALHRALGLPIRLADLQLDAATPAELDTLIHGALGSPSLKRFVRTLDRTDLLSAIATVERGVID